MPCGMVLGEVVGLVDVAWEPNKVDDVVADVVAHPEVSHIHAFGFAWLHSVMEETMTDFVIRDECGWGLRVVEFLKDVTQDDDLLCVGEESREFGFGGRGDDVRDDGGDDMYWAL